MAAADQGLIRRRLVFYGWVQGVGFRYRARHAAALYGCTGWARNAWDGSVVMEIQGTAEEVPFSRDELDQMLDTAEKGIERLFQFQNAAIEAGAPKPKEPPLGNLGAAFESLNL